METDLVNSIKLLLSSNTQEILVAQNKINNLLDTNFESVLYNLATIFGQTQYQVQIRQHAAILLKNTLNLRGALFEKWVNLNEQVVEAIKSNVISCLVSEHLLIRKAGSFCVSAIAAYELPLQRWGEIIHALIENATDPNVIQRETSVTTLLFIGQDIDRQLLNEKTVQDIILAVGKNVLEPVDENLQELALEAFTIWLGFCKTFFANEVNS